MLYYPIYTLRRVIYAFSQVYLSNYPILQKSSNLAFGFSTFLYLITIKPYKNNLILVSNCVSEGLLCLIFGQILFMQIYPNILTEDTFNLVFISLLVACLGFNYIISLISIVLKISEALRKLIKIKGISS